MLLVKLHWRLDSLLVLVLVCLIVQLLRRSIDWLLILCNVTFRWFSVDLLGLFSQFLGATIFNVSLNRLVNFIHGVLKLTCEIFDALVLLGRLGNRQHNRGHR